MHDLTVLAQQLHRHAARRLAGVPTITALVEGTRAGLVNIEHLAREVGVRIVTAHGHDVQELSTAYVTVLAQEVDPWPHAQAVIERLHRGPQHAATSWEARTPAEQASWLAEMEPRVSCPHDAAALRWLWQQIAGLPGQPPAPLAQLRDLSLWLASEPWPLLCAYGVGTAAALCRLCMAVPALPAMALLSGERWREELDALEPRSWALLREGLLELNAIPLEK